MIDFISILKENNCELISQYQNIVTKVNIKCSCGKIFSKTPRTCLKSKNFKCNNCLYPYNIENIDDLLKPEYAECLDKLSNRIKKLSDLLKDVNGCIKRF